jgi:tRNA threonylcarbamoyladenosine biosynthesis protein TsaB
VFTLVEGARAVAAPDELRIEPRTTCVGDGAVRYREVLEALGAKIPPRDSELHLPRARFHVELARELVDPETVEPLYLRFPDAEQPR